MGRGGRAPTLRRLRAESRQWAVEADGGQAVEADGLDQRADVRLRAVEPQRPALGAQALREDGQVDHQRGVGEGQLGEVDDDVARRLEGRGDRPAASTAGRSILVPRDPEDRQLLVEVNDAGKLIQTPELVQASDVDLPKLF